MSSACRSPSANAVRVCVPPWAGPPRALAVPPVASGAAALGGDGAGIVRAGKLASEESPPAPPVLLWRRRPCRPGSRLAAIPAIVLAAIADMPAGAAIAQPSAPPSAVEEPPAAPITATLEVPPASEAMAAVPVEGEFELFGCSRWRNLSSADGSRQRQRGGIRDVVVVDVVESSDRRRRHRRDRRRCCCCCSSLLLLPKPLGSPPPWPLESSKSKTFGFGDLD